MAVVDQRDVQRRGGICATYPTACIVYDTLTKHDLYRNVLDVTYGRGRFYAVKKPQILVGCDPKAWEWIVAPDIFIPGPVWSVKKALKHINIEFDVIVVDPPKWTDTNYNRRDEYNYIVGTPKMIIDHSIELAREIGIKHMLLHYKEVPSIGNIVEQIGFIYIARYLNNKENKSYFVLYKL